MGFNYLHVERKSPSVIDIRLNRPEKRNALNLGMMQELCAVFGSLQNDPEARIATLGGMGKTFCAGLDLQESAQPEYAEKMAMAVSAMLTAIYMSPLVTIAVLQGDAIAGGAGLVAACDFAVATPEARIGFPEIHRGLVAALVSTLLCRQLCLRDVRQLLLTGDLVDAARALEMRLVTHLAPADQLPAALIGLVSRILRGSPHAIKETKALLHQLAPTPFAHAIETALATYNQVRLSDDAKEGAAAFLEKRAPRWSTRH